MRITQTATGERKGERDSEERATGTIKQNVTNGTHSWLSAIFWHNFLVTDSLDS
jgi:hypothetical protein